MDSSKVTSSDWNAGPARLQLGTSYVSCCAVNPPPHNGFWTRLLMPADPYRSPYPAAALGHNPRGVRPAGVAPARTHLHRRGHVLSGIPVPAGPVAEPDGCWSVPVRGGAARPHNYFALWMVTPCHALDGARPVDRRKEEHGPVLLPALESTLAPGSCLKYGRESNPDRRGQ